MLPVLRFYIHSTCLMYCAFFVALIFDTLTVSVKCNNGCTRNDYVQQCTRNFPPLSHPLILEVRDLFCNVKHMIQVAFFHRGKLQNTLNLFPYINTGNATKTTIN